MEGDTGDDVLNGGNGADRLLGGFGQADVANYSDRTTPVVVNLADTARDGGAEDGIGDRITDTEDIWGGSAADTLTGDAQSNTLFGGLGADSLVGGAGLDYADYSDATTPIAVHLGDPTVGIQGRAGEGDTITADVEGVFGGSAADTLTGTGAANFIAAGPGDDLILPGGGADTVLGEGGNDTIDTNDGVADVVDCGAGVDALTADSLDVNLGCESITVIAAPPVVQPVKPPIVQPVTEPVAALPPGLGFLATVANGSGAVTVRTTCVNGPCNGRLVLTTTVRTKTGTKSIVVGTTNFVAATGTRDNISVALTPAGKRMLTRAKRLSVSVKLLTIKGAAIIRSRTRKLVLLQPATVKRIAEIVDQLARSHARHAAIPRWWPGSLMAS